MRVTKELGGTSTTGDLRLVSRIIAVFVSPTELFDRKIHVALSLGVFAVCTLLICALQTVFWRTSVGVEIQAAQQAASLERWKAVLNTKQLSSVEAQLAARGPEGQSFWRTLGTTASRSLGAILVLGLAVELLMRLVTAREGPGFLAVLAVLASASPIILLKNLYIIGLMAITHRSISSGTIVDLLPPIALLTQTTIGEILGRVDLFSVWWLCVVGIGVGNIYQCRVGVTVMVLLAIYGIQAVAGALVAPLVPITGGFHAPVR